MLETKALLTLVLLLSAAAHAATTAPATQQADADAQAVIDKALAYLRDQQQPDGSWQTNEKQPPAITAVVLRAFALDPKTGYKAEFVRKGYDKLLSFQLDTGGIYKDMLANYNTAIAVSALAAANNPDFKPRIQKAVEYLKSLQWTDAIIGPRGEKIDVNHAWHGGWGYGGQSRGKGRPDLSNANVALEALHDAGLSKDDPAYQRAQAFITRLQNNSETNRQATWAGNDGGFVYGPRDDGQGESFAGEYTGPDGRRMLRSYGSMTYAGLKSMIYAGLAKDDPRVKAAWSWIQSNWTLDENPGMRLGDPRNSQFGLYYYYHTLARALSAYGQPIIVDRDGNKHDWRIELTQKLKTLQRQDGSFVGDKRWMEDNPVLTTAYVVLALQEAQQDLRTR